MLALMTIRRVAETCSEATQWDNKIYFDAGLLDALEVEKGQKFLLWYPDRDNTNNCFWMGPYEATSEESGGFCSLRELLAGGALGKEISVHVSRMLPYDMSRSSANEEHQRKLPEGYGVVTAIESGPREDGRFEVRWAFLEGTTWEPAEALRYSTVFRLYCVSHGLGLTGDPVQQAKRRRRVVTRP